MADRQTIKINELPSVKEMKDSHVFLIQDEGTTSQVSGSRLIKFFTDRIQDSLSKREFKSATLLASNWVGKEPPYTNTIEIESITANNIVEISAPNDVTAEEISAFQSALILNGTQAEGTLTLNAWGITPRINLPINVVIETKRGG